MKSDIHPTYYENCQVTCSCGNQFITGSTLAAIRVEVCYKCHPLYTGEKRFIDTLGQVDKFQKKEKAAQEYKAKYPSKKKRAQERQDYRPKSLRELLTEV